METKNGKSRSSGELIQFPSGEQNLRTEDPVEHVVLEALVSTLRNNPTRMRVMEAVATTHEHVEEMLRRPHFRSRLATLYRAFLTEQIPDALERFRAGLQEGHSWAFRVLFDSIGFPGLGQGIMDDDPESRDVLVSSAFERYLVENIRDVFLGRAQTGEGPHGKEEASETP